MKTAGLIETILYVQDMQAKGLSIGQVFNVAPGVWVAHALAFAMKKNQDAMIAYQQQRGAVS